MVRLSSLVFWVFLAGSLALRGSAAAQNAAKTPDANTKGEWITLPKDGSPWKHPSTDLLFPQRLEEFVLSAGFQDKRAEDGVALTYTQPGSDLRADVVIFPCGAKLTDVRDIQAMTHQHLERLAKDLLETSMSRGYSEKQRSPTTDQPLPLWNKGEIPMSSLTLDMAAADKARDAELPAVNQWLALLVYQDHFVQLSVVMPSSSLAQLRKPADQLITLILHCIRYPSLVPEMMKLCKSYDNAPLTDDGRKAADTLLALSKESPVFEVIFPGEALTPCLDEVSARSKQDALDLLRGFVVGSAVVTLQQGTSDESFDEGARLMLEARRRLREKGANVTSTFLDQLASAHEAKHAADFLKAKMGSPAK